MTQFVTCEADGNALCVPIAAVQEIHQIRAITPVRRAPGYIAGLLNLRGHVVTMIDLGARISQGAPAGSRAQNIVLKPTDALRRAGIIQDSGDADSHQDVLGLAVDCVGDVIEVADEDIEEAPANLGGARTEFLSGVIRREDHVYAIVNIGRSIRADEAA